MSQTVTSYMPSLSRRAQYVISISIGVLLMTVGAKLQSWTAGAVPFTCQTLALIGIMAFGYTRRMPLLATATATAYLVTGLAGLPVFSSGGGIAYATNPWFGYLLGMAIMPMLIEPLFKFAQKQKSVAINYAAIASAMAMTLTGILLIGATWLSIFSDQAFAYGFLAFIGAESIKFAIGLGLFAAMQKFKTD